MVHKWTKRKFVRSSSRTAPSTEGLKLHWRQSQLATSSVALQQEGCSTNSDILEQNSGIIDQQNLNSECTSETEKDVIARAGVALTENSEILQEISAIIDQQNTDSECASEIEEECVASDNSPVAPEFALSGKRVVDIGHFISQLQKAGSHSSLCSCSLKDMVVVNEIRRGLASTFQFECNMCKFKTYVTTDVSTDKPTEVNVSAVAGVMSIGCGHSQMEEFLSCMDIPCMSTNTYAKYHEIVSFAWEQTALQEMELAAKEEAEQAILRGEVDRDGIPLLTVFADGCWSKRSYRSNYNALSGVAAIVGYYTRKVLYMGVRNKYCTMCARAQALNSPVNKHTCYKNWNSSSTEMEADIISDGFLQSEQMYSVRYARLVADGDSNCYKRIIETRPYDYITVEKVECRNHLLRNFCSKLREISINSKLGFVQLRKLLGSKIYDLRNAVIAAIKHRKSQEDIRIEERIVQLQKDILNGPSHLFGDHSACSERGYFCNEEKHANDINHVPELKSSGIYYKLMVCVSNLVDHSKSLLSDLDSNPAEHYNSKVAKLVGGKRLNFSLRNSYQARCAAAVVLHNSRMPQYKLHKKIFNKSPGFFSKAVEKRRFRKVSRAAERLLIQKANTTRQTTTFKKIRGKAKYPDKNYGPNCEKPDVSPTSLNMKTVTFLENLQRTEEEIDQIEVDTRLQRDSDTWKKERRKRLTASVFGTVCKRLPHTNCDKLVKQLLYEQFDTPAMKYGRSNEEKALLDLQAKENVVLQKCGLFVDKEKQWLGASPDAIIGNDGIVEIKCPASAKEITPDEGILHKKITMWNTNKAKTEVLGINKRHSYFYQAQGQLHVTRRQYCIFAVWTPLGIKCERIERDDHFWDTEMAQKLETFYMNCLLPELACPAGRRGLPIRNPSYIIEAQKEREKKLTKRKPETEIDFSDTNIPHSKARRKIL